VKFKNMAVGTVAQGLANLDVVVEWTPGSARYALTLYVNGQPTKGPRYYRTRREPLDYNPPVAVLNQAVYVGLWNAGEEAPRLARTLAGFGHFEWFSPAEISREERVKYGADA